jgi:acid phosphatase (class A)
MMIRTLSHPTRRRPGLAAVAFRCAVGAALPVGGVASAAELTRNVPEIMPGVPAGYLQRHELPDSGALLPPPPEAGSAASQHDEEVRRRAAALRGSPRWNLAASDADLHGDRVTDAFSCSLGIAISPAETPRLQQMLQRAAVDAGLSTYAGKQRYQAVRPFARHNEATCTPGEEEELRRDGSYPSGHSALGMAIGLVLAEVAPDRADALVARGRSYGESRVVCNVHWRSDVVEGRFMAAATVARLRAVPEFNEDVAIARTEIAAARDRGSRPGRDCAAEGEALRQSAEGTR